MSNELVSDANGVHGVAFATYPPERPRCAGTRPPREDPCEAPVEAEVDGLHLCGPHAGEFWAQAQADVLEVAELYLCRWLRVAEEELCNGELARHLETAREGLMAETERAHDAPEQAGGVPRRSQRRPPQRRAGLGGRGADPRPGDGASSGAGAEDAARSRRNGGVGDRRGNSRGGRTR